MKSIFRKTRKPSSNFRCFRSASRLLRNSRLACGTFRFVTRLAEQVSRQVLADSRNVGTPWSLGVSLRNIIMKLEDAIIHWVPNKNSESAFELSENTSLLFDSKFWGKKIEESILKNYTIEVQDIPETPSTVIQNIRLLKFAKQQDFIKYSQRIATILYSAQSKHGISDGFLIFFRGERNDKSFVCMLKLEGMQGSEADFNKQRKAYEMKSLEKVLITNKTKVFKMAFFEFDDGHLMHTYVMDDQINRQEVSKFWLVRFLGCRYPQTTEYYTHAFYEFIVKFAGNKRIDSKESLKILSGLYAELNNNNKTLSLAKFAEEYIPPTALAEFNSESSKTDVPQAKFPKSVNAKLKKLINIRKLTLEEGITIQVPQESLDSKKIIRIEEIKGERFLILKSKIIKESPSK
ncbi:nucleoid-associated protein NdpA [Leptospira licerasiae serovar Varillal str. VAR 010]|uniref:Nucleoid-associated protein NdpA n=2 Tax=Leptospira licerasiae TaxID=447106 RepID=A0ABN0HDN6_9LEPT|nr:nucleoid-associated protein NdpA [Leptospira licerasiae serovar Varillal str. VAR 010]EJZ43754.1 nucleoid-associated protein NdpA [Leptospira licerasiae str. MMD4847]